MVQVNGNKNTKPAIVPAPAAESGKFTSSIIGYREIPFGKILPNPANIRRVLDGNDADGQTIAALAESIKAIGLKDPITVIAKSNDTFMVSDGHRRYDALALNKVGPETPIPCIIDAGTDVTSDMLVAGLARKNLHPGEVAGALATIRARKDAPTYGEIAKISGKSESYLGSLGKVGTVGPAILDAWITGKLDPKGANMVQVLLKVSDMSKSDREAWLTRALAGDIGLPEGEGEGEGEGGGKDKDAGPKRKFPKTPKGSAAKDLKDRLGALGVKGEALYWAVHVAAIFGGEPMTDDDFRVCVKGASPKKVKKLDAALAALDNEEDEE